MCEMTLRAFERSLKLRKASSAQSNEEGRRGEGEETEERGVEQVEGAKGSCRWPAGALLPNHS